MNRTRTCFLALSGITGIILATGCGNDPAAVSVSVTPAAAKVTAGKTKQFKAAVTGAVDGSVAWIVSPSTAGTVDSTGLFTARAAGDATVTAISIADTARSGSAKVTVLAQPTIYSFSADPSDVVPGHSTMLTAVFSNGTGTIDHDIGAVESGKSVLSGNLSMTTTFNLTVDNDAHDFPATMDLMVAVANDLVDIKAGGFHSCALTDVGGIKCWGNNSTGALGDGTTIIRTKPADVLASKGGEPLRGVTAVATGHFHTCALLSDSRVKCWGGNDNGQLGNNHEELYSPIPVPVVKDDSEEPLEGVIAITAGGAHTCALMSDRGVKCWGDNLYGELGNNTDKKSLLPVDVLARAGSLPPVRLEGVKAISAGGEHTCALITGYSGDTAMCWGNNEHGQVGDGDDTFSNSLVAVDVVADRTTGEKLAGVGSISAGGLHTCAAMADGGAKCWGANFYGGLGDNLAEISSTTPVNVLTDEVGTLLAGVSSIASGGLHTCALLAGGKARCWGSNEYGAVGHGTTDNNTINHAVNVVAGGEGGDLEGIAVINAGLGHTCALTGAGAKCWGNNEDGELGNGAAFLNPIPGHVTGLSSGVKKIQTGESYACAVLGDGAKCWGSNNDGRLGANIEEETSNVPVGVVADGTKGMPPLTGVATVAVGYYHACALMADGTVKCWGLNGVGELGNNSTDSSPFPVDVLSDTEGHKLANVIQVSAGGTQTCALMSGNTVKCWGNNYYGELGDGKGGEGRYSQIPVDVLDAGGTAPLSDVTAVVAGSNHTCAVIKGGSVRCWGSNWSGQLGDNKVSGINSLLPVVVVDTDGVTPMAGVEALSLGSDHSCALMTGAGARCWGFNKYGQLGNNRKTDSPIPVDVLDAHGIAPLAGVAMMGCGVHHTCAAMKSGGALCWGYNYYGQLGDATRDDSMLPVDVLEITAGVTLVGGGEYQSCALVNGGARCWGSDDKGALGDGFAYANPIPVNVKYP